jgi:hypothetical protein
MEYVLESSVESTLQFVLKFVMPEKKLKKVMVFHNLRQAHHLEVG